LKKKGRAFFDFDLPEEACTFLVTNAKTQKSEYTPTSNGTVCVVTNQKRVHARQSL